MSGAMVAVLGFAGMLVLLGLRMPIGLAMLTAGSLGYIHFTSVAVFLNYMKTTPYHLFANYTLSVIPLFILMGALAEKSGLSTALFRAAAAFLGHLRGGLGMALIGACTGFGAICGSSVATTATFGRATLPEFRRYNYDAGFSTGMIAVGGTLGILIPPSVILVVYAITTEQNIAKLFMAALIPGLLAALFYCIVIAVMVRLRPEAGPALPRVGWAERMRTVVGVWPVLVIAVTVVGGIYGGVFTPTEGASVGCIAMLAVGLLQRTLGWAEIKASIIQTAETSAMIFLILLGAEVFNAFLALSQLPELAAQMVSQSGLPPYGVIVALLIFYIILGGVMDELAMILLTLPIFFPIVTALELGMPADDVAIWFGILVLMVVGIGLTAPPIGLNVFVVSAVAKDVPILATYRGVLPFVAADVVRLGLVVAFPALALWLVELMT
ncbi:TRAP transporter large permease [Phreatobacter sp. AB_2022a]|uniref:TRAP transporter large permease n=1 Tax=Phreatobacter sp. AB_2022a TaxID=3003134 RepID=UPI0022876CAF|nr:TRAP transporter large permease [Phreatobacter sp. AB_2022a]MCZ0737078.1 TRAP transporter large permease [Phreatobacter sp. AB_2022a]